MVFFVSVKPSIPREPQGPPSYPCSSVGWVCIVLPLFTGGPFVTAGGWGVLEEAFAGSGSIEVTVVLGSRD